MSRTVRKPSHKIKKFKGLKKVRDGSRTCPSSGCENNGGCPYCEGNRLHRHRKQPNIEDFEEDL